MVTFVTLQHPRQQLNGQRLMAGFAKHGKLNTINCLFEKFMPAGDYASPMRASRGAAAQGPRSVSGEA
jgi:hypothetical protein